ncbi:MAG TPA: hypothetical protein VM261_26370 [Kofleriaceae bacterium]|nr:hypothetical protein [Kofleriaceae bacterium]
MSSLRLDLDELEHGWLTFTLRGDDTTWSVGASSVFDTLTELAGAALELAEARPVRDVILFEEPVANVLTFEPRGSDIALTVTRYHQESRRVGGEVQFAESFPREVVIRAAWAGLRRLDGAMGPEAIERAWGRPFPAREVEQLGAYVRRSAGMSRDASRTRSA